MTFKTKQSSVYLRAVEVFSPPFTLPSTLGNWAGCQAPLPPSRLVLGWERSFKSVETIILSRCVDLSYRLS